MTDNKPDFSSPQPGLCNSLALAPHTRINNTNTAQICVFVCTETLAGNHRPQTARLTAGTAACSFPHLSAEVHPPSTNTHTCCNNRLLRPLRGHTTSAQRCFDVSVLFFQAHTLMPALYIVATHTRHTHAQTIYNGRHQTPAGQTCVSPVRTVFNRGGELDWN